ncbi:hypothetical protein D9M68_774600 [compost metagenome]
MHFVGKAQGVDVDQRTALALAACLDVLPGITFCQQLAIAWEQALTGAEEKAKADDYEFFTWRH